MNADPRRITGNSQECAGRTDTIAPPVDWQPLEQAIPRDVFLAEVAARAKRIGAEPKKVGLQPIKRKWGTCSTAGRVRFDTCLLRQHADFRNRVIAEELLRLWIPNQSKLSKMMLRATAQDTGLS